MGVQAIERSTLPSLLALSQAAPRLDLPQVTRAFGGLSLAVSATERIRTLEPEGQSVDVTRERAVRLDGNDAVGGHAGLSKRSSPGASTASSSGLI